MQDYQTEATREAYRKGIVSHINGHSFKDNPYPIASKELHLAWVRGYNEKGSVKK